eukprot:CAMPEP_0178901366 /NCGR_PEP_ID=MMETSP0786-20121207/3982_1 /TAXON_ID=186022 /ORGANISM="Thalassionema frauenfeldii, Strain CCMP 1798" /LENGTH=495 /DNA_ID=CAMNT_0020572459 /DNA_START=215 /DNA_END=1699 /DNA_ORIENTATION=+
MSHMPEEEEDETQKKLRERRLLEKPTYEEWMEEQQSLENMTQSERPTQTQVENNRPSVGSDKPKIVVLGASGRIGRCVVEQLMDRKDLDVTVVAVVRDLEKAHKALFDEEYLVPRITAPKKRGPTLQIVLGDLVPPASLPKLRKEEEKDWKRRALSAAKFFTNTSIEDYDNFSENSMEENVALEEALQDASVVISCVGAVRPSWDDLLWGGGKRLLFPGKIRKWCNDARHPFYIHYETTRQALHYIEKTQIKRDEVTMTEKVDDRFQQYKSSSNNRKDDQSQQQNLDKNRRIRFIRISDLMLSRPAWSFVAVWTNLFQSMVFRYQDMTERILQESPHIDTIILRPGDLTDEERDPDITNVQVCDSGKLPYPAIVGREDVASLAVAAALFDDTSTKALNSKHNETDPITPFHITLGVRWCGALDPPFSYEQGRQSSGHATSHEGLLHILKKKGNATASDNLLPYRKPNVRRWWQRRRQVKPYVVFTALPLAAMWVW